MPLLPPWIYVATKILSLPVAHVCGPTSKGELYKSVRLFIDIKFSNTAKSLSEKQLLSLSMLFTFPGGLSKYINPSLHSCEKMQALHNPKYHQWGLLPGIEGQTICL